MNKIFTLFLLLVVFSGCKKAIEKIQEDLVVKAMVDGQWKVTNFSENSVDKTADFSAYRFKYYSNKTVDANKNGAFEIKGNWDGNSSDMTTYANFVSPPYPITLINGTWKINRSGWTYVEATQTVGANTKTMRLDKE